MPVHNTTSVKLDPILRERVQRLATSRKRSPHWVMKEAIQQYLDREEKREQLRADALTVWNRYVTTGLHVTAEEADLWLAKLEAGEDPPLPECHE